MSRSGKVEDVPAVLLVAGVDAAVCTLPLEQTGLERKRGVDILAREFDAVWKDNGGDDTYLAAAAATAAAAASPTAAAAAAAIKESPGKSQGTGAPVDRYFQVALSGKRKDGSNAVTGHWYAHFQGQKVRADRCDV